MPGGIEYPLDLMEEVRAFACEELLQVSRGGNEVGGVLFGTRRDGLLRVLTWRPIACEHAHGESFVLSANDRMNLAVQLELARQNADLKDLRPVGCFLSHLQAGVCLATSDVETYDAFFPESWQVALVICPKGERRAEAGFFFREAGGKLETKASYQPFDLQPLPAARAPVSSAAPAAASPAMSKPEPVAPKPEPVAPKVEPAARTREEAPAVASPAVSKPEPVAPKPEPVAPKLEPAVPTKEEAPAAASPAVSKPEPVGPKPEPAPTKVEPAARPAARTREEAPAVFPAPLQPAVVSLASNPQADTKAEDTKAHVARPPDPTPIAAKPKSPAQENPAVPVPFDGFQTEERLPAKERWLWAVPILLAAGIAAFVLYERPITASNAIGLRATADAQTVRLAWDANSRAVRDSSGGEIDVSDGGASSKIPLSGDQLRAGKVSYQPQSGDMDFEMIVYPADGQPIHDSTRMVVPGFKPATQPPQLLPADQAVSSGATAATKPDAPAVATPTDPAPAATDRALEQQVRDLRQELAKERARGDELQNLVRILENRLGVQGNAPDAAHQR